MSATRYGLITLALSFLALFWVLSGSSSSSSSPSASSTPPASPDVESETPPPRTSPRDHSPQQQRQSPPSRAAAAKNPLLPDWRDELYNLTMPPGKPMPPFFVRPAKRGADLRLRWKCTARKIGPFHVDAPSTPWPTCRMLDHDTDGKTFAYLVERAMCGLPQFAPTSNVVSGKKQQQQPQHDAGDDQQQKSNNNAFDNLVDEADLPTHRPLRVLQVGANTGGNANDPLVKILQGAFAQAVLLEPVPWIFHKLHETYSGLAGLVTLVQAAMAPKDGPIKFFAPRAGMARHGPWLHQMGGLSIPERTQKRLKRMKLTKEFQPITVAGLTLPTILEKFAPWVNVSDIGMGLQPPPDVMVVDAEGYDAILINMALDYQELLDQAGRGARDESIAVIQYENKHVNRRDDRRLHARLERMGYSVTEVYVDTVAVRTRRSFGKSQEEAERRWPPCDVGFHVERV